MLRVSVQKKRWDSRLNCRHQLGQRQVEEDEEEEWVGGDRAIVQLLEQECPSSEDSILPDPTIASDSALLQRKQLPLTVSTHRS